MVGKIELLFLPVMTAAFALGCSAPNRIGKTVVTELVDDDDNDDDSNQPPDIPEPTDYDPPVTDSSDDLIIAVFAEKKVWINEIEAIGDSFIVVGHASPGEVIFDRGDSTYLHNSTGRGFAFVGKFSDGKPEWIWSLGEDIWIVGDTLYEKGSDRLIAWPDGGFTICGHFYPGASLIDRSGKITPLFASGKSDDFIARFDADGNLLWAQSLGETKDSSFLRLVASDNERQLLQGSAGPDYYVAKFSREGDLLWKKRTPPEIGGIIHSDRNGNIYFSHTWYIYGEEPFEYNGYLFSFSPDGDYLSKKRVFTSPDGLFPDIQFLAEDGQSILYGGLFTSEVTLDPDGDPRTLTGLGPLEEDPFRPDIQITFLARFSLDGRLLSAARWSKYFSINGYPFDTGIICGSYQGYTPPGERTGCFSMTDSLEQDKFWPLFNGGSPAPVAMMSDGSLVLGSTLTKDQVTITSGSTTRTISIPDNPDLRSWGLIYRTY